MAKTRSTKIELTVSGTTASGTTSAPVSGEVLEIHLAYSASMAATCDVVISSKADGGMPAENIISVFSNNVNGWFRPRATLVDNHNVFIIGSYDTFHINGYIEASITLGTDTETVTVTIVYEAGA